MISDGGGKNVRHVDTVGGSHVQFTKSNCAWRSLIFATLVVVKMSATYLKNQRRKMRL